MKVRTLRRAVGWLPAALCVLLFGAQAVFAFQPADYNTAIEKPLRSLDLHNYRSADTERDRAAAIDAVTQRYGGVWRVYSWNPQTRTPRFVYGSGIDMTAAVASGDLESIARRVVTANPEVFRADNASLRLQEITTGLGKRAVHFQQTYRGLDVWGAGAHLTFTDAGRLFVMGGDTYDNITVDAVPTLSAAQAEAIARRDVPYDPRTDSVEEGAQLLILPVPLNETTVEHHLVWRVRVHTEDPLGIWVTHVDAHSGEILWRYNDVQFLDVTGNVASNIEKLTWCNGQQQLPSIYQRVQATGLPTVTTDASGNFVIPNAGTNPVNVTVDFYGPYARVYNQAGNEATLTLAITPGQPGQFVFTDRNSQADERDVFDAVQQVHDFFETFAPSFNYTDSRMTCYVSLSSTCNAYYNGNINFFNEGDGCANTGRIQGVVEHEYGHGVQQALIGWQGDEGLGEGNGDILANLLTQESIIGRGFYVSDCENGDRDSENSLIYPDDVVGVEIHYAGRVIAGFHWDLMKLLQEIHGVQAGTTLAGSLWHWGRALEHPTMQPDQVMATFIADDDDGNLDNGTPHYALLCEAAGNHNFDCPAITEGVFITHTPPASFTAPQDVELLATITSTAAAMNPDSLRVIYAVNDGAFQTATLTPTGQPNEYHMTIAGLELPSEVDYYIRATDQLGNANTEPTLAPARMHSFDFGFVYDPFETETGWTVDLEGTDTATDGMWERVDPAASATQPEDDHTPGAGTLCWLTDNGIPGEHPLNNDVDGGTTTLYSPVYSLGGAQAAEVKYWRWYSNNKGYLKYAESWVVQARNNGGAWIDIENGQDEQNRWTEREADLPALFGGPVGEVQFRFVASSNSTYTLIDAAVDEFVIRAVVDAAAVPVDAGAKPRLAFYGSRSNPVAGPSEIAFQIPGSARVRIDLYDVSGRLVRTIADESFDAGVHAVAWDGKDARGQSASSGIYYCRMSTPGFDATQKVVVSR
jgi:Zn-dependent metalloprotease